MTEPRTYNGRNAGLLVVLAVVVLISVLNLLGERTRTDREPSDKVVTTVTPSAS